MLLRQGVRRQQDATRHSEEASVAMSFKTPHVWIVHSKSLLIATLDLHTKDVESKKQDLVEKRSDAGIRGQQQQNSNQPLRDTARGRKAMYLTQWSRMSVERSLKDAHQSLDGSCRQSEPSTKGLPLDLSGPLTLSMATSTGSCFA